MTPAVSAPEAPGPSPVIAEEEPGFILAEPPPPPMPMEGELVGEVCQSADIEFETPIPTVMLLVDRSGSMFRSNIAHGGSQPYGGYPDRWEALRVAVESLRPFSKDVAFSLVTYTGIRDAQCPLTQEMTAAVAPNNFDDIMAMLPPSELAIPNGKGETPTAEGIEFALGKLRTIDSSGKKYLVVITDGEPEMCNALDSGGCGRDPAIAALQGAYAEGIATYVIGISSDSASAGAGQLENLNNFLNDLAHAGAGVAVPPDELFKNCLRTEAEARGAVFDWNDWRPGALATYGLDGSTYSGDLYFQPAEGALATELGGIIRSVRSCSFPMAERVTTGEAGAVQLNMKDGTSKVLQFGTADGFILEGGTPGATDDSQYHYIVTVQGESCLQVQDDEQVSNVRIEFPCEARKPITVVIQ